MRVYGGVTVLARDQPSADLLAALSGVTLLRTDERGTLELVAEAEGGEDEGRKVGVFLTIT